MRTPAFPSTPPEPAPPGTTGDALSVPARVAVWWLGDSDHDSDAPAASPIPGFASRLSRRLVLTYTRRGDALVDLDGDATRRATATGCDRDYAALTDGGDIPGLDQLTGPATMATLNWPRPHHNTVASINDLFLALRYILDPATGIVAVTCEQNTPDAGDLPAQFTALQAAAAAIGYAHVQTIIAIASPGRPDRYLYYASTDEANQAIEASRRDAGRRAIRVALYTGATIASREG
jgi:hypothetical protein